MLLSKTIKNYKNNNKQTIENDTNNTFTSSKQKQHISKIKYYKSVS